MSDKCKNITNPLRVEREGSNQQGRTKKELLPQNCLVDARTEMDDLVFVKNLSQNINFYDQSNIENGDWGTFYSTDLTVTMAFIAMQEPDDFKAWIQASLLKIKDDDTSLTDKKLYFTNLFRYCLNLAWQLDEIYKKLPDGNSYKNFLHNLILRLSPVFSKCVSYYKGAVNENLVDNSATLEIKIIGEPITVAFDIVFNKTFSSIWSYAGGVATLSDSSIYGSGLDNQQLFSGVTHNFFTDILFRFLQVYSQVINEAKNQYQKQLTEANHEPHITLLLSFLMLFQYSRRHLNGLTARHLDLYFREILKLKEKTPQPNFAHVNFELAKHIEKHLLKKHTLLKAGKDATGNEVFYKTLNDLNLSRTKVSALYSFYRGTEADDLAKKPSNNYTFKNRIFASENLAESTDFQPLANKIYKDGYLDKIDTPTAKIGFAIASNHLFLRESNRTITLSLTFNNTPPLPASLDNLFDFELTTEKEWVKPSSTTLSQVANILTVSLTLDEKIAAIVPYNSAIHAGQFLTQFPMLKITLKHTDIEPFVYEFLENTFLNQITLQTTVTGVKNLYLQNDFGILDASKPFMPFGATPITSQSNFILGSNEVFQKKLTNLSLNWSWKDNSTAGNTDADNILARGVWQVLSFPISADAISKPNFEANPIVSAESKNGYIKVNYDGSFQTAYNTYLKNVVTNLKTDPPTDPPSPPNPPMANALSLTYTAIETYNLSNAADFTNNQLQFFHVLPYGSQQRHFALTNSTTPIVPQFQHTNDTDAFFILKDSSGNVISGSLPHQGECYIGLKDLTTPAMISLLFQVVEGSSNPQIDKPEHHVHWSFLDEKGWQSFPKNQVFDDTLQLTKSGITSFNIPKEASTQNPMMPLGNLWLKASVSDANEAICKLIGIHPNAILAVLTDADKHEDLLEKPVASGTIAKLAEPIIAIKKVNQLYDSFGGRAKEKTENFYTRVSERLRHKDRAVTTWDYENLILEAFSSIYKAKCLNHTRYQSTLSGEIYNELAPQHITIITIPNLQNRNQIDPLKPYTSVDVLEEIKLFLGKRTSPFVKLHVRNPVFEQVKITCKIKFFAAYDASLMVAELQKAITRFLSPWAFEVGKEIVFGGKIEKSVIINFIEEQEYVDYLTDIELWHKYDTNEDKVDETVRATKGISILVSAPAIEHQIEVIPQSADILNLEVCRC